jgi:hypothetical protein
VSFNWRCQTLSRLVFQEWRRTTRALEHNRTQRARLVDALQQLAHGSGGGYSEAVSVSGCHHFSVASFLASLGSAARWGMMPSSAVLTKQCPLHTDYHKQLPICFSSSAAVHSLRSAGVSS